MSQGSIPFPSDNWPPDSLSPLHLLLWTSQTKATLSRDSSVHTPRPHAERFSVGLCASLARQLPLLPGWPHRRSNKTLSSPLPQLSSEHLAHSLTESWATYLSPTMSFHAAVRSVQITYSPDSITSAAVSVKCKRNKWSASDLPGEAQGRDRLQGLPLDWPSLLRGPPG